MAFVLLYKILCTNKRKLISLLPHDDVQTLLFSAFGKKKLHQVGLSKLGVSNLPAEITLYCSRLHIRPIEVAHRLDKSTDAIAC